MRILLKLIYFSCDAREDVTQLNQRMFVSMMIAFTFALYFFLLFLFFSFFFSFLVLSEHKLISIRTKFLSLLFSYVTVVCRSILFFFFFFIIKQLNDICINDIYATVNAIKHAEHTHTHEHIMRKTHIHTYGYVR